MHKFVLLILIGTLFFRSHAVRAERIEAIFVNGEPWERSGIVRVEAKRTILGKPYYSISVDGSVNRGWGSTTKGGRRYAQFVVYPKTLTAAQAIFLERLSQGTGLSSHSDTADGSSGSNELSFQLVVDWTEKKPKLARIDARLGEERLSWDGWKVENGKLVIPLEKSTADVSPPSPSNSSQSDRLAELEAEYDRNPSLAVKVRLAFEIATIKGKRFPQCYGTIAGYSTAQEAYKGAITSLFEVLLRDWKQDAPKQREAIAHSLAVLEAAQEKFPELRARHSFSIPQELHSHEVVTIAENIIRNVPSSERNQLAFQVSLQSWERELAYRSLFGDAAGVVRTTMDNIENVLQSEDSEEREELRLNLELLRRLVESHEKFEPALLKALGSSDIALRWIARDILKEGFSEKGAREILDFIERVLIREEVALLRNWSVEDPVSYFSRRSAQIPFVDNRSDEPEEGGGLATLIQSGKVERSGHKGTRRIPAGSRMSLNSPRMSTLDIGKDSEEVILDGIFVRTNHGIKKGRVVQPRVNELGQWRGSLYLDIGDEAHAGRIHVDESTLVLPLTVLQHLPGATKNAANDYVVYVDATNPSHPVVSAIHIGSASTGTKDVRVSSPYELRGPVRIASAHDLSVETCDRIMAAIPGFRPR